MKKIFTAGLLLLAGAMTLSAQTLYAGSEPTNGGEFYLYNVETGLWIQSYTAIPGADRGRWNTSAGLGDYGRPFKLESQADGSWILNTLAGDQHLASIYAGDNLMSLDYKANDATWTLTGNAADGYTITSGDAVLGVGYETYNDIEYPKLVNDATENTHWQFVTADERLEFMANATVDNPQDVSWLMINPELMNNDRRTPQWSVTRENGEDAWRDRDYYTPNRIFETWNYTNFDFYQTITVPNGKYELTAHAFFSPTEGGATNYNDYSDYLDKGAKTVNGYLYANSESVELPSIYSFTSPTPVGDYAAKELPDGDGTSIIDGVWQGARAMAEDDQFKSEPITVTVTDGQLRLGIKETNNSGNSHWIFIGNFKLKYLGNQVDLSEYISNLEKTLAEAKAFNGNTTGILQQTLNGAIAYAEDVLASANPTEEELSEANANLSNALNAARNLDDSLLEAIVALAENEGVDTADAEEFLAIGTDHAALETYINDLRVARKVAHIETDNAVYEGHAPAEGDFYLYNVGRKAYLTNGSDWGTHAALGYPGLLATLAKYGDGYTIQFNGFKGFGDGDGDMGRDKFLNGSPYCDSWDGDKGTYVFEEIEGRPNVFAIKQIGKGDYKYLAFDPNGAVDGGGILHYNTVTSYWETPKDEDAYWMLVSKEDRLAQMEKASWLNPVDVTVLIKDASFNKYEDLGDPWIGIHQWLYGERHVGDKNTENINTNDFKLYQVITLPKAGYYELSVQAYFRDGTRDRHVEKISNDVDLTPAPGVYVEVDGETIQAPIMYIHEEADNAPGEGTDTAIGNIPDGVDQAAKFFENGLYWSKVEFKIEEIDDDEGYMLPIGIIKTGDQEFDNWIVADNFRLKYMGTETNGIDEILDDVKVEDEFKGDNVIYNLQGIRVANPTNGIFIKNGKKVYIK